MLKLQTHSHFGRPLRLALGGEYINKIVYKRRTLVQTLRQLENQAQDTEKEYIHTPSPEKYASWQCALKELSLLRVDLTKKSMLASAQRVLEYGDKNGRLLAWLAKGQFAPTHVGRLRSGDGTILTTPEMIGNRFLEFYQDLYSSTATYTVKELTDYLDQIPFPTIDPDKRTSLEKDITLEEVQKAMSCMQSGKAPGPDGLPIEFYSTHQELLAPRMTSLLSQFAELGILPDYVRGDGGSGAQAW